MSKVAGEGDVVAIPIEESVSVAQVVRASDGIILLAVFPDLFQANTFADIRDEYFRTPIYMVGTMDTWITDGRWRIVGNRQVSNAIEIPRYKVEIGSSGTFRVQDFNLALGGEISREEASLLRNHKTYSPVTVIKAIRAYHDLGPWESRFEELVV